MLDLISPEAKNPPVKAVLCAYWSVRECAHARVALGVSSFAFLTGS